MANQKQTTIHGAATVQDGAPTEANYVLVWSAMRYPYTIKRVVSRYNHRKEAGASRIVESYTIKPGANRVPRALWDVAKNNPLTRYRLDHRDLVESNRAPIDLKDKLEAIALGVPPEKHATIKHLCPAAAGTSMKSALRSVGAPPAIADMDDESAAITLES